MSQMLANDEFQGLCLQSQAGHLYMSNYDILPSVVRERLRNSPFNLCAACVFDLTPPSLRCDSYYYLKAIDRMETMIRCEEVQ